MTYTHLLTLKSSKLGPPECYYSQKQMAQMSNYFRDQLEAYYARIEHIDPSKMYGC